MKIKKTSTARNNHSFSFWKHEKSITPHSNGANRARNNAKKIVGQLGSFTVDTIHDMSQWKKEGDGGSIACTAFLLPLFVLWDVGSAPLILLAAAEEEMRAAILVLVSKASKVGKHRPRF